MEMNSIPSSLSLPFLTSAIVLESSRDLRWEVAAIAVGAVLLSFGLAGTALFIFQPKIRDRSLIWFSVFALLYAIRLIYRQTLFQSLMPVPREFWNYWDYVVDNFIAVPMTLFLLEIVHARWKPALRWLLGFQIVFATARLGSQVFKIEQHPMETTYRIVIAAYRALLLLYPFLIGQRGERLSREVKAVYAGLAVFAVFVFHTSLVDLGLIPGRNIEPLGIVALVCCLGYVAALRTYSNEQRLLSIQRELEVARQIQSSILPKEVPRLAGLEIAATYVPMSAVAGDFYDFIVVDDRRLGILVADVTGHGVPAALIASMLKGALAAQSVHAADPGEMLRGLNHALCGKFEAHFVSACYLYADIRKRTLRYAAGGHPPLLFGSPGSGRKAVFREIQSNGLLLGVSEDATYSTVELPVGAGDRCVLYTDGVVEAQNAAQEEFGSSRLLRLLEDRSNLGVAAQVAELLNELDRWCGAPNSRAHEDDITVIALAFE